MGFRQIMKKAVLSAALLSVAAGAVGCGAGGADGGPVRGLPDYEADRDVKQVYFGAYIAPVPANTYPRHPASFITTERYREAKEAGLDFVIGLYEQGCASPDVLLALECAAEAGMKYMVRDDGLINYTQSASLENMRKKIEPVVSQDACFGISVKDEPSAAYFSALGKSRKLYEQITDKPYFVNLFPNYATPAQLGNVGYTEYVERFCSKVGGDVLSVDHYPLGKDVGLGYGVNELFLSNLEIIQTNAAKNGMEHWEYLQGMEADASCKRPDYNDMRFQIYTSMAYGTVTMNYFCYFTPSGLAAEEYDATGSAFIDGKGDKTDIYYAGQKINAEIHAFDHVYRNFTDNWLGVMTKIGSKNEKGKNSGFNKLKSPLASHERVSKFECEQDAILGAFKDKDGRDGFMLVNYGSAPGNGISNKTSLTFADADKAVMYRKGEKSVVDLTDGAFDIELEPGEGVFLIPVLM